MITALLFGAASSGISNIVVSEKSDFQRAASADPWSSLLPNSCQFKWKCPTLNPHTRIVRAKGGTGDGFALSSKTNFEGLSSVQQLCRTENLHDRRGSAFWQENSTCNTSAAAAAARRPLPRAKKPLLLLIHCSLFDYL